MPRLRGNSVEIATNEIIRKIDNFDFCTGDVVSDADLAKELGISRTPVREAMQQLISAGLLERKATHVIVKAITISDIIEILQVRECMECKSVELILVDKGLLQSQIEELRTVNQELSKNVANIGVWAMRHKRYLKQNHKVLYYNLLTSGKLNSYLADIEQQAQDLFLRLVNDLAEKENITEELKSTDMMLWVQKMNNIRNRATEIVNAEIIYAV